MTPKPDKTEAEQLAVIRNLGGLSLVVVVVIGGLFYWSSTSADRRINKAIDDIVEARTEARHTTCARANLVREEAGNAAAEKARDFIRAQQAYNKRPASTGDLLAAENDYIESQRQVTLNAYPKQDCSDDGVAAFYKNPPVDPYAENCEADGRGLCKE